MQEEVWEWTWFSVLSTLVRHLMLRAGFVCKGLVKVGHSSSHAHAHMRWKDQSCSIAHPSLDLVAAAYRTLQFQLINLSFCFVLFCGFFFFSCGFMELYSAAYFHLHNCVYMFQIQSMMCYSVISKVINICLFKCSVQWFKSSG